MTASARTAAIGLDRETVRRPAAAEYVSIDVRVYTRQCLETAAAETGKGYDHLIRDGIHALGIGFPKLPTARDVSTCEQPHRNKFGQYVVCRRGVTPHPGILHVWWASHVPDSREEWP